ncbi:lipoprotein-releasing system permease protein [Runella defluvii]|uniref:Lipoprotein-releasing system permease protein n=1 Tax=Runella defluvii TaxID=370973 RepID=A0A7W6ESG5_9BACT|nr:FtsX-like permease family protein [Runella defluvii]MBB3840689.1 lipoprotein-releasing system permease protein [Runella defluvii]
MNFPLFVARRYFTSKKKKSFISLISNISMLGVGVGTMALVIVMSVFNGMGELNRQLFRSFDPDLKVTPAQGKRFTLSSKTLTALRATEGVKFVTQVVEDNALATYGDRRVVTKIKGVDETFIQRHQLDTAMIEGKFALTTDNEPKAIVGGTVQQLLGISVNNLFTPLELAYPRSDVKTLNLTNADAFNQQIIRVGGVYMLELRFDDYVIVPLEFATELLGYGHQRSALEIQLQPSAKADQVQTQIQTLLGDKFVVRTRDEQNADLLRAIRIEKLFVTVTLGLIILVAAVNIFFSLSMLVIEKRDDIKMLFAMGATASTIQRIFLLEGSLVAFTGAFIGLILGIIVCWFQQTYGLVSMGMVSSVVDAYPVKMEWPDFVITAVTVISITILVSFIPAQRASRL